MKALIASLYSFRLAGLIYATLTAITHAQPVLVENFEGISGALDGQRGWAATLVQIEPDPAQTGNQAVSFEGAAPAGANLPLAIPEGATATLFFRVYSDGATSLNDFFAGMSDVAAISGVGAYPDFEAQIGYAGAQILDTLRVRDGSTAANEAAGEFLPRTWYKIWAVIDNAADTYEVYIQGGSFDEPVQVSATNTGNTMFLFRNSGAGPAPNDLVRFFVKSGAAATPGPALLDDIYLAPGRDLTDPVPGLNKQPKVSVTSPTAGASFTAPASISLAADATDTGGTISLVEFYDGETLIGTDNSAPFTATWNNAPAGFHTISARATDNQGGTGFSRDVTVTVSPGAGGAFVLRDSFENATLGDLNGQNGWNAASATVIVDPTRATNQVASFEGSGGASLAALVPEGGIGTVFFRVFSAADTPSVDWCAGLSDIAAAGPASAYGDFEAQICVAGAQVLDRLTVRDGGVAANVEIGEFRPRTWYKIWLVVDNAIDQTEVYIQGGQYAEPTLLQWAEFGYSSFVFRNSGVAPSANDLSRFLVRTSPAHSGQFVMDDLYVDQFGKNLNDPVGALAVLPDVAITAPAGGAEFTAPANITLSANASHSAGSVAKIEFFAGSTLIGTDTTSPYSMVWTNPVPGAFVLTAKATDAQGGSQISAPVSITVHRPPAGPGFQLIENFQAIPAGDLNGQAGWSATLAQVKADPAQPGNKVASFEGAGAAGANIPLVIPEGTTATLFYRIYSEADTTLNDFFAGMSDATALSGVGAFGDFETQVGYSGAQILDTLRVRDGSTGANEAAGEFLPRTWYNIWQVIDNAADTYEVFIQGGSFTEPVQVAATSTGNTLFLFRNSGAGAAPNDLTRFFVKSGTAVLPGPALLDDIYFAQGRVLTNPVPTLAAELRIVETSSDATLGNFTFSWEGGVPPFQVEKSAAVTGPYQALGAAQSGRSFTDAGAIASAPHAFYRVKQGSGPAVECKTAAAGEGFVNTPFASQSGSFTAEFEATPAQAPIDSVIALSAGERTAFNQFAVLARFNPTGNIDARNAGAYAAATPIPYSAGVKYKFRLVIDLPSHTYSVFVTPDGGAEQTVASNFAFRTEQNTVTELNHWAVTVASTTGSNTVCDFQIR